MRFYQFNLSDPISDDGYAVILVRADNRRAAKAVVIDILNQQRRWDLYEQVKDNKKWDRIDCGPNDVIYHTVEQKPRLVKEGSD